MCWGAPHPLLDGDSPTKLRGGGAFHPEQCHHWWAGRTPLSYSALNSAPTFPCDHFILVFGRFPPTLIKAWVAWAENESGWPEASCSLLTSTLSRGNYANYHTGAQDWIATMSGLTVMDATNLRGGGQLLGWRKNHLLCQEMLSPRQMQGSDLRWESSPGIFPGMFLRGTFFFFKACMS